MRPGMVAAETVREIGSPEFRETHAFEMLLQAIPLPVHVIGAGGRVLFRNVTMQNALGDSEERDGCWTVLRDMGRPCWDEEQLRMLGGKTFQVNRAEILFGGIPAVLAIFLDITPQKSKDEQRRLYDSSIWKQANHDSLTGLPNRNLFLARLNHAIRNLGRERDALTLLFLDLDNLKVVNDSSGHGCGDKVLMETARRIIGCVRDGDTVARLGGDEFTVILPGLRNRQRVEEIAEAILGAVRQPIAVNGQEVLVTASMGVAFYPTDSTDTDGLLKSADLAMYAVKKRGGNGCAHFVVGLG